MSDADVTLTASQANRNGLVILTGTLSATRTLTLPANDRRLVVCNATTGGHDVVVGYGGSGEAVSVAPGAAVLAHGDGADLFGVGGDVPAYDFGMVSHETPGASDVLGKVVIPRALRILADLVGSVAHVDTPPDNPFVITLTVNGTAVATITIATDGSVAFATSGGAPVSVAAGDAVRFLAPASADASITGIAVTIAARRDS